MADVVVDVSKLNGFFKNKYAKKLKDLVPEAAKITGRLPFEKAGRIGNKYNQPVELVLEQGVTYAAAGAGAFDLEEAVAGEMKNAEVDGSQFLIKGMLDYESAAKATSEGEEAFGSSAGRLVKRLLKSIHKRVELSGLYGGTSLGVVASRVDNLNGTGSITFTPASWAVGIWTGMKNAKLDIYSANANGTPNARINANLPIVISSVDPANKKINITGNGADITAIAANHLVVFRNAVGKEMVGLDRIVTNSGTLFSIDGSANGYEVWGGNVYAVGGTALNLTKLLAAPSDAVGKGLDDEKISAYVNPKTWTNLISDQAALRKYDHSFTDKAKNGFRALSIYSHFGEMEIIPHTLIKEGEAQLLAMDHFQKIGATDVTANLPGRGDEFFRHLETKAGYELRMYANLAIFCDAPGLNTKLTGIVNS